MIEGICLEIIILGKEAHTLLNASCSFQLPLRPQHMLLAPLALVLNCACSSAFASKAVRGSCPPTGTARGAGFSSLLGPRVCSGARGLGSAPDLGTKLCVAVRKLLCFLEPQLPRLLLRDAGNAEWRSRFDEDWMSQQMQRKRWVLGTAILRSVQLSRLVVSDSATPWTAASQASLSITNSQSSPKLKLCLFLLVRMETWSYTFCIVDISSCTGFTSDCFKIVLI